MTGLRMVMDRPFFGVGIRCFGTAHAMNYSPGASRNWLEAHSLYVQVPAELGLVGAAVFFTFVFEFLRLNRRTARRLREAGERWRFERALLDALFAGFVVLLISGFFGHSLLRRTWYLYAGLGLVVQRLLAAPGEPGPRAEPRAVSPARGGPADA
jgi:O-antigen ligase